MFVKIQTFVHSIVLECSGTYLILALRERWLQHVRSGPDCLSVPAEDGHGWKRVWTIQENNNTVQVQKSNGGHFTSII